MVENGRRFRAKRVYLYVLGLFLFVKRETCREKLSIIEFELFRISGASWPLLLKLELSSAQALVVSNPEPTARRVSSPLEPSAMPDPHAG